MKKDRKRRKEAVKRLEKLEDMNRAGEAVTVKDFIGALYPNFIFDTWRGKSDKELIAELLEEVKSLVDVKDYMSCPRSRDREAIYIGDVLFEINGEGEPLTVEEITIRHGGSIVKCKSLSGKTLTAQPRELTFEQSKEAFIQQLVSLYNVSHPTFKDCIKRYFES